jgi:peptidylprolyl isomerase/peptidyl-prolyl cis-trans isomerase C
VIVHASHILVRHQYEAEDILTKLRGGDSFEELARKWSMCSSAKVGGDLGPAPSHRFHEDFLDAYLLLKSGEVSKTPVRTPFGFHILLRHSD